MKKHYGFTVKKEKKGQLATKQKDERKGFHSVEKYTKYNCN